MTEQEDTARDSLSDDASGSSATGWPERDYGSFLARSEAERRLLAERMAEADKGVFISSEAMLRWVESWGTENELPPPEPDVFLKPRRS